MDFSSDLVHPTAAALGVVRTNDAFFSTLRPQDMALKAAPHTQAERPVREGCLADVVFEPASNGLKQEVDGRYYLNGNLVEHPRRHEVVGYFNPRPGELTIQIHAFDRITGKFLGRL